MGPQKGRGVEAEGDDMDSEGSRREEGMEESEREEKLVKEEEEEDEEEEEEEEEEEDMEEEEEEEEEEGDEEVKAEDGEAEEEKQQQRPRENDSCAAEEDREDVEGVSSSPSATTAADDSECILVKLADIRKEVQCPICLGIIKKTRTVMECLHRFCRDCIDKSMRLGNNECPACRTHCASRRSLRDDPNYDSLIAALYPDIEKYEEQELTFHEEERNRNKKIQLSIAATLRRQAEALGGKRRFTRNMRSSRSRSFMNLRGGSDDEDGVNANDWERDSTPTEEPCVDVRRKRPKRSAPRPSRSAVVSDADEGCDGNEDGERETRSASPGRTGNREVLVWGKGGTRSQTRHGGGINGKNIKGSRITKMVDYLRSYVENDNELDVHLTLLPLGDHPKLDRPHLCCQPTLTIRHICEFVARQTSMTVEQIEILARKPCSVSPRLNPTTFPCKLTTSEDEYQILGAHESVDGLYTCFASSLGNLVFVYRVKISG